MIRAKATFVELNEKSNTYFLGLEKSTQSNNIIRSVQNNNDILITKPDEVLNEIKNFYQTLFKDDVGTNQEDNMIKFMEHLENPKLSEEEKLQCDKPILTDELYDALKQLNDDSSPGSDGLSPSFYIKFWPWLHKALYDCLIESINKEFSQSTSWYNHSIA